MLLTRLKPRCNYQLYSCLILVLLLYRSLLGLTSQSVQLLCQQFLLCDATLARYMLSSYIRLLKVSVLIKWLNLGSHKQCYMIAQSFLMPKILQNLNSITPNTGIKCR